MEHLLAKCTNALYSVKQKEGKRLRVIYMYHNNEVKKLNTYEISVVVIAP